MNGSPYLAQALQSLNQQPAAQAPAGPDLGAMVGAARQRQAWQAQNPGQSYLAHNISQIGSNLRGLPGRVAGVPGVLGMLPAQAAGGLAGLFALGRH